MTLGPHTTTEPTTAKQQPFLPCIFQQCLTSTSRCYSVRPVKNWVLFLISFFSSSLIWSLPPDLIDFLFNGLFKYVSVLYLHPLLQCKPLQYIIRTINCIAIQKAPRCTQSPLSSFLYIAAQLFFIPTVHVTILPPPDPTHIFYWLNKMNLTPKYSPADLTLYSSFLTSTYISLLCSLPSQSLCICCLFCIKLFLTNSNSLSSIFGETRTGISN